MIPKTIHYIFGLDANYCGKPLAEFHYLNLLSARKWNADYDIILHYYHIPTCRIWEKICRDFETKRLYQVDRKIGGKEVIHTEHIGDYLRLQLLRQYGGIYLDIDVVCIKPFNDLLNHKFVMGIEKSNAKVEGLCNAVMMGEVNSAFGNIWIDDYNRNYQPEHWNVNSVVRPYELSANNKHLVEVLPHTAFFKYSWDEIDRPKIFGFNGDVSDSYCLHLWETKNYDLLRKYDRGFVKEHNDTLSKIYKM